MPTASPAGEPTEKPAQKPTGKIVIVGGGNAGVSLAARLLKKGFESVVLVSPQPTHRYRPLLNYVAGGEARMESLERPMEDLVPEGCTWIQESVSGVDPRAHLLTTKEGSTLGWDTLVLCPGLAEDWDAVPGLREAYLDGWAFSSYVPGSAPQVWPRLSHLTSGSVLFSLPPEPAPSAATALKPLFLACSHWQRTKVLSSLDVTLLLPGSTPTGLPAADERLEELFSSYGVKVLREARVEEVDPASHTVSLTSHPSTFSPDLAHLVPPYAPPSWIQESGLAGAHGLVDVHPGTLRHRRHPDIWALGDAATLDTSSSGGALRKQVSTLVSNLQATSRGESLQEYDGYTTLPITTSRHHLLLAEMDREGNSPPLARFLDLAKPRLATWVLDRYILPSTYWHRILKGSV